MWRDSGGCRLRQIAGMTIDDSIVRLNDYPQLCPCSFLSRSAVGDFLEPITLPDGQGRSCPSSSSFLGDEAVDRPSMANLRVRWRQSRRL